MSIFSLKWFKSKKQRQLESLQVEEQELKNEFLRAQIVKSQELASSFAEPVKLYKNIKMVNDILTVVLNDGSIISKPGATASDFNAVREARTEEEIVNICSCSEVIEEKKKREAEVARARAIQAGIQKLSNHPQFIVEGNTVYFKGISRSLPQLMVEEILGVVDDCEVLGWDLEDHSQFVALKRFFMWCCLNPRAEVADDLYGFLKKNSFRITKQGFFVALRNVVTLGGDKQLIEFVSNAYNKVRAVWKKDPTNYWVYKVEETEEIEEDWYDDDDFDEYAEPETRTTVTYFISNSQDKYEGELVGNLKDLYAKLPEMAENRYTDAHTRTFDIRVGRVVNMPPEECNWNRADCAHAGLHFTADEIHYVGCGDTSVLILINPMKVVGIGDHKGRCYEYLPIMTVPRVEATEILHDLDFDCLELDEDYAVRELTCLEEKVKTGFVAEATKYEFNLPNISTSEIRGIVASLDEMRWEVSKRVVSVD
jgi:hypothetical protein